MFRKKPRIVGLLRTNFELLVGLLLDGFQLPCERRIVLLAGN